MKIERLQLVTESAKTLAGQAVTFFEHSVEDVDASVLNIEPESVEQGLCIALDQLKEQQDLIEDLRLRIAQAKTTSDSLFRDKKDLESQIKNFKSQVGFLQSLYKDCEGELANAQTQCHELSEQLKRSEGDVVSLQADLKESAEAYAAQRLKVEELQKELLELKEKDKLRCSLNGTEILEEIYQLITAFEMFDNISASNDPKEIQVLVTPISGKPRPCGFAWVRVKANQHVDRERYISMLADRNGQPPANPKDSKSIGKMKLG